MRGDRVLRRPNILVFLKRKIFIADSRPRLISLEVFRSIDGFEKWRDLEMCSWICLHRSTTTEVTVTFSNTCDDARFQFVQITNFRLSRKLGCLSDSMKKRSTRASYELGGGGKKETKNLVWGTCSISYHTFTYFDPSYTIHKVYILYRLLHPVISLCI